MLGLMIGRWFSCFYGTFIIGLDKGPIRNDSVGQGNEMSQKKWRFLTG